MHITPRHTNQTAPLGSLPLPLNTQHPPLPDFLSTVRHGSEAASSVEAPAQLSLPTTSGPAQNDLKDAFQDFVGQTFFGEMIKAFRTTQQPSKYFHGGRAEEIFQGQFDQVLSETLSDSSAEQIANPMYELFMLKRGA